jgi:hypothetical protein
MTNLFLERMNSVLQRLLRIFHPFSSRSPEPGNPADPHAYVTAPKKPRPMNRSGAAVAELPEE